MYFRCLETLHAGLLILTHFINIIFAYFDLHHRQFIRYFERKNQSRTIHVDIKCFKNKRTRYKVLKLFKPCSCKVLLILFKYWK